MIKQSLEQVKTFYEDHKREIFIGAGITAAVVGSVVMFKFTKKSLTGRDLRELIPLTKFTKLDVPGGLVKKGVTEVSSHNINKWADIWFEKTPLSELGNIGKELCDAYNWTPDRCVSGVLGTDFAK